MKTLLETSPSILFILVGLCACSTCGCSSESTDPDEGIHQDPTVLLGVGTSRDGLIGWNIVSSEYEKDSEVDMLSFEWDYFMIHSEDGAFTGSLGYLFANPRNAGGLGDLVPKGGNLAIAGRLQDGTQVADYQNFGLDNSSISSTERLFEAQDASSQQFGKMTPIREGGTDRLHLEGKTDGFSWNLEVKQDWPALSSDADVFAPMRGDDVGKLFPGENWNVNMLWPRTKITGTITRLDTNQELPIVAHGYRENSWGRWAFNLGGWDFGVVSDEVKGVSWAWQSYHPHSAQLDYVDLGFVENGEVVLVQFQGSENELGWTHPTWTFDSVARQCVPLTTMVIAQNETYRVETHLDIGDRQVPMLSDATSATQQYVIIIQFPMVEGKVIRRSDGEVVTTFSGQGGGEFSTSRSTQDAMSDEECEQWGKDHSLPMPE